MSTQAHHTHSSITAIEDQLLDLAAAERTRWQVVSRLLIQVEAESLWEEQASSFTSWIDGMASRASMQPSGLWRSLKAGRIYLELAETDDFGVLDNLNVTAECLELVDKISRHAPAKISKQLVKQTLAGEMEREELRRTWRTYRPAAGGITARGRLPVDPAKRSEALERRSTRWTVEKRKPEVKDALAASQILASLATFEWLGPYDQAVLETDVTTGGHRLDAVAFVRRSSQDKSDVELHGLEVCGSAREVHEAVAKLKDAKSGLDFLWLAVPDDAKAEALQRTPAYVGVLASVPRRAGLSVAREVKAQRPDVGLRQAWLTTLLSRAHQWPGT